jgi:hypothetical protein
VQELNIELWRQRHEQLLLEAQRGHLVRQLREARRGVRYHGQNGRPGGGDFLAKANAVNLTLKLRRRRT